MGFLGIEPECANLSTAPSARGSNHTGKY